MMGLPTSIEWPPQLKILRFTFEAFLKEKHIPAPLEFAQEVCRCALSNAMSIQTMNGKASCPNAHRAPHQVAQSPSSRDAGIKIAVVELLHEILNAEGLAEDKRGMC